MRPIKGSHLKQFDQYKMLTVDSTRAFDYHWQLWSLLGIHAPRENTIWHRYYTFYKVIFFGFFIVFIPTTLAVQPFLSTSLATACEALCIAVPGLFELLKLANVWRVRGKLQESHKILRQLDRRLMTRSEREIIRATVRKANRIFFMLFVLFLLLLGTGMLHAVLSQERELIFTVWIPWDWKASRNIYLVTASLHLLGLFGQALLALNNDTYPVSYLTIVAAHIMALKQRVLRIGRSRRLQQSQRHQQLIESIQDHQLILKLVTIMQSALSMAFFFQFFCTAISQCAAIFYLAYVDTGLARAINMIFIFAAITNETLFICYAAEVLSQAGEKLSIGIYSCNWLDQSTPFRRDLLFMLMRSQRSTSISAAGFIRVRVSTMITVVKGAYTMFALLNEIGN